MLIKMGGAYWIRPSLKHHKQNAQKPGTQWQSDSGREECDEVHKNIPEQERKEKDK